MKQSRIEDRGSKVAESITRIPLTLLKLPQLKKLERAAWKLTVTLESLRKQFPETIAEYDRAAQFWNHLYAAIKARNVATAEREELLWTVFVPEKHCVKEIRRTKHWRVTRWWNNKYPFWGEPYKAPGEPDASNLLLIKDPWRDFANAQKAQVAA